MNARPLLVLAALAAATTHGSLDELAADIRGRMKGSPMGTVAGTVLAAALLFYQAERGKNPKVKTFGDALVYVSTCLSVGYSDIFAKTEAGKLIGTALMTYGPSLATRLLDEPEARPASPAG